MGDKRCIVYKLYLIFFIDMFYGRFFGSILLGFFLKWISECFNFYNCFLRKKILWINKKKDEIEFY